MALVSISPEWPFSVCQTWKGFSVYRGVLADEVAEETSRVVLEKDKESDMGKSPQDDIC